MASFCKEVELTASADVVWNAVRDFGALHKRLVPGFATDAKLDGDARIVTFANGNIAREVMVDCDDANQRLVYAVISERVKHYNAAVRVKSTGKNSSTIIWTIDLLPNEIAAYIEAQMNEATAAMKKAFLPTSI